MDGAGYKSKVDNFYRPHDTIYDARVLWDEYNHRFWIAALASNKNSLHRGELGPPTQATYDTARSRRVRCLRSPSPRPTTRATAGGSTGRGATRVRTSAQETQCPDYGRGTSSGRGSRASTWSWRAMSATLDKSRASRFRSRLGSRRGRTGRRCRDSDRPGRQPRFPEPGLFEPGAADEPRRNDRGASLAGNAARPRRSGEPRLLRFAVSDGGIDNVLVWTLSIGSGGGVMWQQPVPVDPVQGIEPPEAPQPSGATTRLFGGGITKLASETPRSTPPSQSAATG